MNEFYLRFLIVFKYFANIISLRFFLFTHLNDILTLKVNNNNNMFVCLMKKYIIIY